MHDFLEWLEKFTGNIEDTEVPAPAHNSQDLDSESLAKAATRKHSVLYSLSFALSCFGICSNRCLQLLLSAWLEVVVICPVRVWIYSVSSLDFFVCLSGKEI